MNSSPQPPPTDKPTLGQVALGVLVAYQFVLLGVSNAAGYLAPVDEFQPPPSQMCLRYFADRYAEATGQPQGWGMFSNGAMSHSVSYVIYMNMADGHWEKWYSTTPDATCGPSLRLPAAHSRRYVFESSFLGFDLVRSRSNNDESNAAFIAAAVEDVRFNNASYIALMRASVAAHQRETGRSEMPLSVILWISSEPILLPYESKYPTVGKAPFVVGWTPGEDVVRFERRKY